MRKILDISFSASFKSPSRFVLICSFLFIAHMKSLISTFNCSLLQQTFPLFSIRKIFNSVCRSSNFSAGFNLSRDLRLKCQSFKCHRVYPVAAPIFATTGVDLLRLLSKLCGHKSGAARVWLSATDDELAPWKQKMKTSARPVYDWLSLLKDLTEGTPRGGGQKRNLAVQSIPHHSSLFTCLPVSTPGSLSTLGCLPSRRPPLLSPTQSEDTLPPPLQAFPLSFSHFKLSMKLTFYRRRGTSKVFDELD